MAMMVEKTEDDFTTQTLICAVLLWGCPGITLS
jgi:hypothetical protein